MSSLINQNGTARLGIFPEPIDEVNYRDFNLVDELDRRVGRLRRYFAFNQFEFLGAVSEQLVFGCALADVKYAGTAFVYAYDPSTRQFIKHSFQQPLARGIWFNQRPESGASELRVGQNFIQLRGSERPRARYLQVRLSDGFHIDAEFSEEDPPVEPLRICTPAGATGWVYARKTAGHRVAGTLTAGGRTYDLAAIGALGHHDWTAGYMRRHTFWNWGCIAGHTADGRVVGMNVSCGVNETSFTENCFWLDGKLHKLDTVRFEYDRRDLMQPWRMTSYDGRLDLTFRPEGRHREKLNAFIVASNFSQLIGRYDGWLQTAAGERVAITNLLGYAEWHYAKW
ncbi:MAG: DUF2804 domain-containing protein [Deltaproteobacteria bacterium]|nr:DUF2804 domain-containing protein [Deltaproteobacteria bacterium]